MKNFLTLSCFLLILLACNENIDEYSSSLEARNDFVDLSLIQDHPKFLFSKLLYNSMIDSKGLRGFLREEGLRKFNNDTDVLFSLYLDSRIEEKTFFEILGGHNTENLDLRQFFKENPLYTLHIPTLPNGFNAESWDCDNQIPSVAFNINGNWFLYSDEGLSLIETDLIPGFPTLVLKTNERIRITPDSDKPSFRSGDISFSFIDDVFDGRVQNNQNSLSMNQLIWSTIFDPKIYQVRNVGDVWQRDYVYFGITQNQSTGVIDRSFRERLFTIKFNTSAGYYKISQDYSGANGVIMDQRIRDSESLTGWTDGIFEFRVTLVPNDLTPTTSNAISSFFQAKGSDLFDVTYTSHKKGFPCLRNCTYYKVSSITPKEFYIPYISFFPVWDVNQYGIEWRLFFEEVDSNIYVETSETNTIKRVINAEFSASFGDVVKIGPKYGASIESTKSVTNKRTFNQINNDLGNTVIYWYDPFVLSTQYNPLTQTVAINPLRYNTGWLQFTFLPNRAF